MVLLATYLTFLQNLGSCYFTTVPNCFCVCVLENMDPLSRSSSASFCEYQVTLQNDKLWQQFHKLDTEMIITKSGRRMFPSIEVKISQMNPLLDYCVFLEFIPARKCRFKYSSLSGWGPAGSEEAQSCHCLYLHPESPAKGDYWMSRTISFNRVKLTNTPAPPSGQVVLSSMHKYQPRIVIVETSDPRTIGWSPNSHVAFPETQFIAVTAYQNEKITQLKIDNNPFAKGFRHNGQAKCKRKRQSAEEENEEEFICVDDTEDLEAARSVSSSNSRFSDSPSSINGMAGVSPSNLPERLTWQKPAEREEPKDLSSHNRNYGPVKYTTWIGNSMFNSYTSPYLSRNYFPLAHLPTPYVPTLPTYIYPTPVPRNVDTFNMVAPQTNCEEPKQPKFTNFFIKDILRK